VPDWVVLERCALRFVVLVAFIFVLIIVAFATVGVVAGVVAHGSRWVR
jgi:hypothetical protein